MEKKIMYCVIVCSIMFWRFAINVKAEENDLIMYDYVHQTEHKYSIGLDRKLQKTKRKKLLENLLRNLLFQIQCLVAMGMYQHIQLFKVMI